ncbi:ribbon-helix-helix protein, CopG family [Phenylobacterium sp.]|uniref:ribbon-helix-helix domain-containing protein n=1 Tax=Phenylobacterium sp. TaxID=1871053 RepID=UPI0025EC6977|nr:ribbon-helix-helix protein, CopG family [Phenylobacterium sp.]MBX3482467.1 ribbon-helix-helix protein, CopG family [Phenylobacterium sp.]MCW5759881.1 ribbon-helix-helix protein, CopG family [Phenylobacterium sp.]
MSSMNISLPDSMKTFVDEQVEARGFATSSEFIRELIRREQEHQKFRALILEGMESPSSGPPDFESLRERIRRHGTK